MTNSTRDGLGYEELAQPGSQVANVFMTGSVVTDSFVSGANVYSTANLHGEDVIGDTSISGAAVYSTGDLHGEDVIGDTSISGAQVYSAGDVQAGQSVILGAGSPYGEGVIVSLTARSNISGGMFVSASGGLAYAAPINTLYPIGIALPGVDIASGGEVSVITHGVAAVVAEATVAVGEAVIMGAGAAQNCVLPADTSSGLRLFGVLDAAGSEGTVFITL